MGLYKLGGLVSGLDTETLIKQLLAIERRPVALLEERKDKLTTEANAWRDLNSRLLNLQNRLADLKNLSSSVWQAKAASVSDTTMLTASASATAQPGTYTVDVIDLAAATTWESGLAVADPDADLGFSGTITVSGGPGDGQTFDVAATDSLHDIAATINQQKETLGFSASVIQVSPGDYRLVLAGQTGSANHFELTGAVATSLQIDAANATQRTAAADAQITVNGVPISAAGNTVNDAVPGLTMNLLKTGTSTITVTDDHDKVVEAVRAFVDQYNSVVDFMAEKTKYDPESKEAGALFGESLVQSIQFALGTRVMNPVEGVPAEFQTLSMVGISMEKFSAGSGASRKLTFDETKFREALEKDPDAVAKLFTLDDGTGKGVAVRLEEWLEAYTKSGGLVLNRAEMLDQNVKDIEERIAYFDEVILPMKEKRLRDQYIALEKAMAMFQNQGDWLSQQIKSLSFGKAE